MLVHDADARGERRGRRPARKVDGTPRDREPARVGPHETGQHVHQRRLPGAVLAEEREDLTGAELEIHAREGAPRRREGLLDSLEADGGRRLAQKSPRGTRSSPLRIRCSTAVTPLRTSSGSCA